MIIAVIGGSQCSVEEARLAEAVGAGLAQRGVTLVCGGLTGVMEAAARGATQAGGHTVGILPGRDSKEANPYIKLPIVTNLGYARNVIVVLSAQAVIAIGGSYGTLSEIAHARQYGIPVVGIHTWQLRQGEREDQSIIPAQTAEEAVDKAIALARERQA